MPVQPTYPGVYIEEIPSGVHTITGVATSITAFIGRALRGPVNKATTIESYADFERIFGGLWLDSTLGYAVQDFFLNGGSTAVIVRLFSPTEADLRAAQGVSGKIQDLKDTVTPSTPATLAAAIGQAVNNAPTKAARDAWLAGANAALTESKRPNPDSVRQMARSTADASNAAALAVAKTRDTSPSPTAQSTSDAMNKAVAAQDPDKTAGTIIAQAAAGAVKPNATVKDVTDAADAAVSALKNALDAVVTAPDATKPPTSLSTAAAIRKVADATAAPNKAVADLVAIAAEQESTYTPTLDSVRQAAKKAADENAATLPVTKVQLSVGGLPLVAASQGSWGANLSATIDNKNITQDVADAMSIPRNKLDTLFNLTVTDATPGGRSEQFRNLTVLDDPRRVDRILETESQLVRWGGDTAPIEQDKPKYPDGSNSVSDDITTKELALSAAKKQLRADRNFGKDKKTVLDPDQAAIVTAQAAVDAAKATVVVSDGNAITENEFVGPGTQEHKWGLFALEQVDLFNLLCIPPYRPDNNNVDPELISPAAEYCAGRRAMLLVDAPSEWKDKDTARELFTTPGVGTTSKNAALFFPRLKKPNILRNNQVEEFVPCGTVAGIFARTDAQRGVWKAPAGLEASLVGVPQLSVNLTDAENGELNPLGINCLRAFPIYGRVVWGSRTLRGADQFADEYKYIPVRRTALFIEESLYRGTQWVVFEPNDEPLWAQIRLNVGAFMHNLFRQGAFQGQTPRDAYLVKCDSETTTQNDINLGIVNILVAFAPLKPAEFVIIQIQQLAGQIAV